MTLKVLNLVGGYSRIPVLKDISFEVRSNEIVGLIGLNGAGKSTTIKHIIGLLKPISGSITIDNKTLTDDPIFYKSKLSYIPETPVLYEELTLKEHIDLTIMAYNLDYKVSWNKVNNLLKIFRLDNKLDWFPTNFSKGMRQKVMIICSFITQASLFIIDEPFYGLDPLAINDLIQLIKKAKRNGASILMSTHILSTAQDICDRFIMINKGRIVAIGTLESLREKYATSSSSLSDIYLNVTQGEI